MRPVTRLLALLLVATLIVGGALFYRERARRLDAEHRGDVNSGDVLSAVFSRARDLRVATLSGRASAHSQSAGLIFSPDQTTVAPYTVSYFVPLRQIGPRDMRWDAARRTLTVTIPDVIVEPPSIDMSRAAVRQHGIWISRGAGIEMQGGANRILRAKIASVAGSDANVAKARQAAVAAVRAYTAQPLAAAGLADVRVAVRFPWQGDAAPPEPMDRSRSLRQVFGLDP